MVDLLVHEALAALERSSALNPPDRRFGAAVLTADGEIFASSAYWSDTLALCLHAEQAALAHAAAHGKRDIVAVACVSSEDPAGNTRCHPCGMCKQLIYESGRASGRDIEVCMADRKGRYAIRKASQLDRYPWPSALRARSRVPSGRPAHDSSPTRHSWR